MKDNVNTNRLAWDCRTAYHLMSPFYDVTSFLRGSLTLKSLERDLCGTVSALSLLHLQCHFGLDTLSWARLGAKVTGVDFCRTAIEAARELANRVEIDATFILGDVQALPESLDNAFDRVVSTYGTLCWLSQLSQWATGIARSLRPGGRFVLVEFHPILDVVFEGCISKKPQYFGETPTRVMSQGSYAARDAPIQYEEVLWQHPISEVVKVLLSAGLVLDHFGEHPFCSYPIVPLLDVEANGYWSSSVDPSRVPYLYSIVASKHKAT